MPKIIEHQKEIGEILYKLPSEITTILEKIANKYLETESYQSPLVLKVEKEGKELLGTINPLDGSFLFSANYILSSGTMFQIIYLSNKEDSFVSVKLPYLPKSKVSECIYLEEDWNYPMPHFECSKELNRPITIYEVSNIVGEILSSHFGIKV